MKNVRSPSALIQASFETPPPLSTPSPANSVLFLSRRPPPLLPLPPIIWPCNLSGKFNLGGGKKRSLDCETNGNRLSEAQRSARRRQRQRVRSVIAREKTLLLTLVISDQSSFTSPDQPSSTFSTLYGMGLFPFFFFFFY